MHEARKNIKRARAALALLRAAGVRKLGKDDRQLRKAGHLLSSTRDAYVLKESFEDVKRDLREPISQHVADHVERLIENRLRRITRRVARDQCAERAGQLLRKVRRSAKYWKIGALAPNALKSAVATSARAAREAMAVAKQSRDEADVHRWRRRVKTLYLQRRLMKGATPAAVVHLNELETMLGNHQNLALFRAVLLRDVERGRVAGETQQLLDGAARKAQRTIRRNAFRLGRTRGVLS